MILGAIAISRAHFGQGTGPIFFDDVSCTGSEVQLALCSLRTTDINCAHSEDAGVNCQGIATLCSHVHVCVHASACVCMYMYVCVHACMCVCTCMCVVICIVLKEPLSTVLKRRIHCKWHFICRLVLHNYQ